MAIAQVAAFGPTSSSGPTLVLPGITCAAGNVLAIDVLCVNTGNTPISVTGVADNTAGSLKNSYQVPPGAHFGAFFAGQNQFALVATILCQVVTALSASTVTVTFSTSAGFSEGETGTYSGLTGGLFTVAAALSSLLTTASSAASPSAIAGPNNLVIAVANINGAASSASGGFALRPDNMSAWLGTTNAATASTTFTLTASDPVWGTTIVAFGPVPVPQAPRRALRAFPPPRRTRQSLVPQAQPAIPPAYPLAGIAQHRQTTPRGLPRRTRITIVVRAQVNPPFPLAELRQWRQPRGFFPRRGHGFSPVPPQQAAPVAAFVWQPPRHARIGAAAGRRGRITTAHLGQHEPPRQRAAPRARQPVLRRSRIAQVPQAKAVAAAPAWVQSHRSPARLLALLPRRVRQLLPWPQAAQPANSRGTAVQGTMAIPAATAAQSAAARAEAGQMTLPTAKGGQP